MANITWAKLRDGNWGLRSDAALERGFVVTVTRKNGVTSPAIVGNRVATDGATWWLYAIGSKCDVEPSRMQGWGISRYPAEDY